MRKLMFVVPAAAIAMLGAGAFGLKAATLNSPPVVSAGATQGLVQKAACWGRVVIAAGGDIAFAAAGTAGARPANAELSLRPAGSVRTPEPAGAQQSLPATAPSWPLAVRVQLRTCVDLPSQLYCDPSPWPSGGPVSHR
jgi:hypothetical protein